MRETEFLAELFHHRWAVPVVVEMARRGGGRGAELAPSLGASRGGVRQAMASLVELGLARRNPGHGHPLRPEYVLTPHGELLAAEAARVVDLARSWSIQEVALRKWPLPVAYGLGEDGARFSQLRVRLPGITDRALSAALADLGTARLTRRVVEPSRPPAVRYLPTARAAELLPPLRRLASPAQRALLDL